MQTLKRDSEERGLGSSIRVGGFTAIVHEMGDFVVAEIAGRMTASSEGDEVDELLGFDFLVSCLRAHGCANIVFDTIGATEVDSAGERRLRRAKDVLERELGGSVLVIPEGHVCSSPPVIERCAGEAGRSPDRDEITARRPWGMRSKAELAIESGKP